MYVCGWMYTDRFVSMSAHIAKCASIVVVSVRLRLTFKANRFATKPLRIRGVWKFPFTSVWLSFRGTPLPSTKGGPSGVVTGD